MRLKDKTAIITGGSRGIGKAVAQLFAKEGASVWIWDVLKEGKQTADSIQATGGKAQFAKVSVTDTAILQKESKRIYEAEGKIDILINNAGITRDRTMMKMSDEEWQSVIDVNLTGVYNCTKAVVPYMIEQKYGRIVSAASNVGLRGNFGQSNYSAAKAAIIGMTKTWALEFGKYGITANSLAPGFTETEMTAKIPKEHIEAMKQHIPLRTVAQPIDIAYGYLYLASDEAKFVSGICLTIDGGVSR